MYISILMFVVETKHIHKFLPITFLIYNKFSIQKMFWKAETQGSPTIPSDPMYVDAVNTSHKISNAFNAKMYQ